MRKTVIAIFCLLPLFAHAYYKTNLSLIYKRKVEQGPVLTQEFHKSVFSGDGRFVAVETKLGVECKIKINYDPVIIGYGPSDHLFVDIQIKNRALNKIIFSKKNIPFSLGKQISFNFTSKKGDELSLYLLTEIFI